MITPDFARAMARYNRWQNGSLTVAADGLTHEERWRDRGAFFGSIVATLNHILGADRVWLARLSGDDASAIRAAHPHTDRPAAWPDYVAERRSVDAAIVEWADGLTASDMDRQIAWMRGGQPVVTGFGFNVVHMFNHQTHHRGQVHAMLTAAGAQPEPTDLPVMPE